ncbi:YidB family protein, partial [Bradyrhizobium sp.]
QLTAQSGLSRDELLNGLSQYLPKVIDQLTPDGRLPTEHELAGRI